MATESTSGASGQTAVLGALQVRQIRTKRKMEAYPSETELFVERRTSFEDWPV